MCQSLDHLSPYLRPTPSTLACLRSSRLVCRKYRRLSLRHQMRRLRRLLPHRPRLSREEVVDGALELIRRLEEQLVARVRESGAPLRLSKHLPEEGQDVNVDAVRRAVGRMMEG